VNYSYSEIDRLVEPHNYMYTPFLGEIFLRSYQSSRMAVMHRHVSENGGTDLDHMFVKHALQVIEKLLDAASLDGGKKYRELLGNGGAKTVKQNKATDDRLDGLASSLNKLTTAEAIATLDLLHALIAAQLINAQVVSTKIWIDRLVQRFEVTKKLYECYPPGFRKGEGANTSVRLYWLFALALSLFYAGTNNVKYLSALLKICDLLCSLPEDKLLGHIPEHGMLAVLATEFVSVQILAEKKGVSFATV
jgi:hypothetical protein